MQLSKSDIKNSVVFMGVCNKIYKKIYAKNKSLSVSIA